MSHRVDPAAIAKEARTVRLDPLTNATNACARVSLAVQGDYTEVSA
jgi:hypothetical protein